MNIKINKPLLLPFTNKRLKKIVNVYQKNNQEHKIPGIGDYLRGCFCLLQLCKRLGLDFDMYLGNHPLSKFLQVSNEDRIEYGDKTGHLEDFGDMNHICIDYKTYTTDSFRFYNKVIEQLNSYTKSDTLFMLCNSFPIWKNVFLTGRRFIQYKMMPTTEMQNYVRSTLVRVGLRPKRFGLFHIRTGDKYLNDDAPLSLELAKQVENVIRINMNPALPYLVLSDNNKLKMYLKKTLPRLSVYILPITHLGESNDQTDATLRNTMLDFFVMSRANSILSISPHNWGSGFSEWCATMYSIPYKRVTIR